MVRINRLLEAMRVQSQREVIRLAVCEDDGHGAPDLISVTDVAQQSVGGAAQNELMGADCWIAIVVIIIRKRQ